MNVDIRVEYTEKEVEDLIISDHFKKFGDAPAGSKWVIERPYGGCFRVKNEKLTENIKADDAPASAAF